MTSDCKPNHLLWSEAKNLVVLAVENQSYAGLTHRRTVLFVDQRYFVIHDEAEGSDSGDVRLHFQFAPCTAELRGLVARTRFDQGANLVVKTFPLGKEIVMEQEEGWISYAIAQKEKRPAWSWKINKQAGDRRSRS